MFNKLSFNNISCNFKTTMKVLRLIVFVSLWVFSTNNVCAQSISAQVSTKRVQVGEAFEFAVVISGAAASYNQPYFRDFDVVSGPNQSTSIQNINGVVSQQLVFSYALVAKREGKLTIPSANCMVNGQRLETQPIIIEAVKNAQSAQQSGSNGADVFVRTVISKSKFYIGEPITVSQKIYSRHQIINYAPREFSYDGFYSQQLESPEKGQLRNELVDGINYYVLEINRTQVTANKSGRLSLSSIETPIVIRRQSGRGPRNIWEQLLGAGYEDVRVEVKSKPTAVEVLPLPELNKPENFTGAVGVFNSKIEASRTELKANESFTLKYTISGKGNLKLVQTPILSLPESFETYEPKTTESASAKTFEFLIVPRQAGDFTVSDLNFSYFNLDAKKYVTINTPDINFKIFPGDKGSENAQVYSPSNQIKTTENDIRYIKKGNYSLVKSVDEFFNSTLHLILLVLIPVLLLVAVFVARIHQKNNSDINLVNQRKAAGMAKKRLVNAEKMMTTGNKDAFYSEVLTALNNYISYRFAIPVAELSKDKIINAMSVNAVPDVTVQRLLNTLQASEYAKYAPGAVSGDLKQVYNDTVLLVTDIEQQLNRKKA